MEQGPQSEEARRNRVTAESCIAAFLHSAGPRMQQGSDVHVGVSADRAGSFTPPQTFALRDQSIKAADLFRSCADTTNSQPTGTSDDGCEACVTCSSH